MNKSKDKYWKTCDRYLAAYLFAKGAVMVGIEAHDTTVIFTFIDSLNRQPLVDDFSSGKSLINAKLYAAAVQHLDDKATDALMESYGRN